MLTLLGVVTGFLVAQGDPADRLDASSSTWSAQQHQLQQESWDRAVAG